VIFRPGFLFSIKPVFDTDVPEVVFIILKMNKFFIIAMIDGTKLNNATMQMFHLKQVFSYARR
jgi:hypothetical protein